MAKEVWIDGQLLGFAENLAEIPALIGDFAFDTYFTELNREELKLRELGQRLICYRKFERDYGDVPTLMAGVHVSENAFSIHTLDVLGDRTDEIFALVASREEMAWFAVGTIIVCAAIGLAFFTAGVQ